MRENIGLNIRIRLRMSEQGFQRLGVKLRSYYSPFVFKTVWSGKVSCNLINTRIKLAKFLFERLGQGDFLIFKTKDEFSRGKEGFKYLARVQLIYISELRFDYEYTYLKGISRYEFWEGEE